jgi:poly(A) polymerase
MRITGCRKPLMLLENRIEWSHYIQELPEMKAALEILNRISERGGEAFVVGGAVRDILMGKMPSDIDIVTSLPPEEIEQIFPHHHDIGSNKSFGVTVVSHGGFDFEIATYRTDMYSALGLGATFVQRASSFEDDVRRRDFTINGMGIDKDGNVIDFVNGEQDITGQVIRAIGDPDLRFGEDYVRMLRAIRFASRSGFSIDDQTGKAIRKNSEHIQKVSPERVFKELKKTAEQDGNRFADAVLMLREYGILKYILPEVDDLANFEHSEEKHPEGRTVLDHVIAALRQNRTTDPVINLSILLHDIGNIKTHSVDEHGVHKYLKHAEETVDIIDTIAKRMKLDNETRDAMKFAALNHMKFSQIQNMRPQKLLNLMSSPYWPVLLATAEADARSRSDLFSPQEWSSVINLLDQIRQQYGSEDPLTSLRKIVNGQTVMRVLGIPPSRKVGDLILAVIDDIIEHGLEFQDEQTVVAAIRRAGKIIS